jgi:predicted TIM-barrel fold metal-dependent hydrolase
MSAKQKNPLHGTNCSCCGTGLTITRRGFVAGASAAAGLLSDSYLRRALAQTGQSNAIIDVHHHVSPPTFVKALEKYKLGERPMLDWTPAKSIEDMDRAGVVASISSITTPGVWFGDRDEARALARECNDYGAKLVRDFPGRFGLFASLPLPNVDDSLKEIEYAFDTLKADGVGVMTSFGDKWLGDSSFTPVMEELNRRKAIVYTHPSVANCCRNLQPDVHYSVIELAADTTRAVASLMFSGTAARYPDIRYIFSHAGGTVPFIYQRFTGYPFLDKALGLGKDIAGKVPDGVLKTLQSFYYDTAQAAHPMAMQPLTKLVSAKQILFGTDYPFRTASDHVKGLADCGFSAEELTAIYRGNAQRLMPQFAK